MYCKFCGAKLTENANFCTNCGKVLAPAEEKASDFHRVNTQPVHLYILLAFSAALSICGYLLQNKFYSDHLAEIESALAGVIGRTSYPYGLSFFSIWHMLIPALVGCGVILWLHHRGKIVNGRISRTAFLVSIIAFVLKCTSDIIIIRLVYWFMGLLSAAGLYVDTTFIDVYGLGFLWPWLALIIYLAAPTEPSPKRKRNALLIIGALIVFSIAVFVLAHSPLYQIIAESAGLLSVPIGIQSEIRLVFLWIPMSVLLWFALLSAHGRLSMSAMVVFAVIVLAVAILLSVFGLAVLHLGISVCFIATSLAYVAGAAVLFRAAKKEKNKRAKDMCIEKHN